MAYRALLIALAATACAAPEDVELEEQAATNGTTVVSLTFDDTFADNYQVATLTEARGMRATFYINSARIGQPGYLTFAQVVDIEDRGHEIAGHTLTHARLASIPLDEARYQVCNDRRALLDLGFRATSFAYPFSSNNAAVRQMVADCGYNSARIVGGLVTASSCAGCPYGNPRPPPDPFAVRTHDSVEADTTLDEMKANVMRVEQNGGGWVPMVFHHVCDGCDPLAISPATLAAFLDWLALRAPQGTVVGTVDEVIGGAVKPGVSAPPATRNLLANASLETDANNDQVPDCWQRGGTGTNTATYTLTNTAYDGTRAQRIDVTSITSGARRLVSAQDTGACAPAITPGRQYTVSARYIANSQPLFSIYYRDAAGSWIWFAQSPRLPTSSSYVLGSYTTPALPAGATAISVGLSITGVGALTMDAFSLVDATSDTTAPAIAMTSPGAGATISGTVQLAANASDAVGIARVDFLVNGTPVGTDTTSPYAMPWDSAAFAGQTVTLTARAVDTSSNMASSASSQITVAAAQDTTPPTVALTSPPAGATVTGVIQVTANAADAGGVARVELLVNGALVATDLASPYAFALDTTPYAGQTITLTARAFDNAGNNTTSASRQITVSQSQDTTPPTVAMTSPAAGATVSGSVQLTADATDAGGIARVEFLVNGAITGTDTTSPYAVAWNSAPFAGTTVTLAARAVDGAGNITTTPNRTVTVAAAPTANLLQNASLETDANGDQVPDCWQRGGSGTNAATYTLTTTAFSGVRAQRIDMTSYTSGARRLVTSQSVAGCSPAATAGRRYTVTARYIATAPAVFTIYYRNASGAWVYFAQSPALPTSSAYALGSYTTAPLPAGATAISVGLSIINLGSVTMDDFTLVDAGP
ncbi:MAG: Ig-like domain-containing protein [Myxococcota bacterium]|nr:Ig-like domain-containing protein [Myxococcota bacterium]